MAVPEAVSSLVACTARKIEIPDRPRRNAPSFCFPAPDHTAGHVTKCGGWDSKSTSARFRCTLWVREPVDVPKTRNEHRYALRIAPYTSYTNILVYWYVWVVLPSSTILFGQEQRHPVMWTEKKRSSITERRRDDFDRGFVRFRLPQR